MNSLRILVTGASGFVGSKFIEYALNNTGYVIMGIGRKKVIPTTYSYIQQDLCQPLSKEIEDFNPDVIVHCAALSSPWGTYEEFYKNNVEATKKIVDLALVNNARLVYISSSSVFYQDKDQLGITEETPKPNFFVNDYALTKYCGEMIVKERMKNYIILRPRAVFGPGDTVLFPRILKVGKIPYVKNKEVIGDLIYIDNLAYYILKSCQSDVVDEFNLTNNKPVNIHNFLEEVFQRLEIPYKKIELSIPLAIFFAKTLETTYKILKIKKEPPITTFGVGVFSYSKTFNIEKTLKQFGYPPYSNEEGLKSFIDWFKLKGDIEK